MNAIPHRTRIRQILLCLLLAPCLGPAAVPILFDTDMDTDCDDAGALAMLHALADAGEVEILGTLVSSHYPYSAPAVAAINAYYGRPGLPIGVPKEPGATLNRRYRYAKEVAEEFPSAIRSNEDAPDAVSLYRKLLAAQPDGSVRIVTVGYLTNIRYLLQSGPDSISSLSGKELIKRKVERLVIMGGDYPEDSDLGVHGNFKPDPESTIIAVMHWPARLIFSGLGEGILTGAALAGTPANNPVRRAYEHYLGDLSRQRPSWDQTALLYAVRGAEPHFREITTGYNRIFDNGTNQWRETPDSDHIYIELKSDRSTVAHVIEELMIRPPALR